MKVIEKIALVLFSIIIIIVSTIALLIVFNVVEIGTITEYISNHLENEIVTRVVVATSIICILLALKSLFFPAKMKKREEIKSGVLLENQDGRLLISKDTIENLVTSVVKSFPDAISSQTKVFLDADNNITVFISLLVNPNAVIKELSANIQTRIKETIKRNTDLTVKQVNINIKNIDNDKNEKEKKEPAKKENSVEKIKLENVKINQAQIVENNTANEEKIEEAHEEEKNIEE